jgi:hypothetical protein
MTPLRPALGLLRLLLLEVAAVVVLHRLGGQRWLALPGDDWASWLHTSAPEDVLATCLRVVALLCAWWLLGTTVLYVAARVSRFAHAVEAVTWVTLPAVRRVADRAVAVAVTTSVVLGGSGAAIAQELATEPPIVQSLEGLPINGPALLPRVAAAEVALVGSPLPPGAAGPGVLRAGALTALGDGDPPRARTRAGPIDRGGRRSLPTIHPPQVDTPSAELATSAEPSASTHVVAPGEHLWGIATSTLARARGVPEDTLSDRDVHGYWVALIGVNRATLRSGDPSLLRPGEVLQLPAVP